MALGLQTPSNFGSVVFWRVHQILLFLPSLPDRLDGHGRYWGVSSILRIDIRHRAVPEWSTISHVPKQPTTLLDAVVECTN